MSIQYKIAASKARKKFNFYRTLTNLVRGIDGFYKFFKKGELNHIAKLLDEEDTIALRLILEQKMIDITKARIEQHKKERKKK